MPKITVAEKTVIADPRAGAYLEGRLLSAARELQFKAGTWDVSEEIAAIWNGTYVLPEGVTDRHGKPLKPTPSTETLTAEPTSPIDPEESLSKKAKK